MGMADKMSADHPLIIKIATEGIPHSTMNPTKPDSRTHSVSQTRAFLMGKLPAGPAGRDDIEGLEPVRVGKAFQAGDCLRLPTSRYKGGMKTMDDLFRMVAIPTALKK